MFVALSAVEEGPWLCEYWGLLAPLPTLCESAPSLLPSSVEWWNDNAVGGGCRFQSRRYRRVAVPSVAVKVILLALCGAVTPPAGGAGKQWQSVPPLIHTPLTYHPGAAAFLLSPSGLAAAASATPPDGRTPPPSSDHTPASSGWTPPPLGPYPRSWIGPPPLGTNPRSWSGPPHPWGHNTPAPGVATPLGLEPRS